MPRIEPGKLGGVVKRKKKGEIELVLPVMRGYNVAPDKNNNNNSKGKQEA